MAAPRRAHPRRRPRLRPRPRAHVGRRWQPPRHGQPVRHRPAVEGASELSRHGVTIPFDHVPLPEQREWYAEAADLGYTDLWSSEAGGTDAFTPLDPAAVPPILVAALRPGMLRLAGREGDGAIINWLSADDVRTVAPHVGAGKEIVARIFVCPSDDTDAVRAMGRFAIAAYLNVPVYAAFHEWLGRGDALRPMWDQWKAGDRKAAVASIPDQVVDELIVHGAPAGGWRACSASCRSPPGRRDRRRRHGTRRRRPAWCPRQRRPDLQWAPSPAGSTSGDPVTSTPVSTSPARPATPCAPRSRAPCWSRGGPPAMPGT